MNAQATIFAVATAPGRAGVAVVRISGTRADEALTALAGRLPPVRVATLMTLREGAVPLDRALVLRFAAGASFTGEPTVELHLHGGRAVVAAVMRALAHLPGLRPAEAGEFTRRALDNGRLDLAQVEALGDLIAAETEMQRRQAVSGLSGAFGSRVGEWRRLLLNAKALTAADIDFSDEGDAEGAAAGIDSVVQQLIGELADALAASSRARIVADGARIAIIGAPNAGKSTLLNALAGADVAIVTEHAGTTRDLVEATVDVNGYRVTFIDTAGLRKTADPIERLGIERSARMAATADLVLVLSETDIWPDAPVTPSGARPIRIRTKCDDGHPEGTAADVALSGLTRFGLDSLMERLQQALDLLPGREMALMTTERQVRKVQRAVEHLREALSVGPLGIEFVDEHLQRADQALAEAVGAIHAEDVLGAIFNQFCIGK